jgi:Protein of unknown function DUF262/Protein of unknown function (DUF1524)
MPFLRGGLRVTISSQIEISHDALANILSTRELSMDINQRSYAWEKEHVKELFQDLQEAISGKEPEYFLGSIVVTRSEGHVVDGQQRLATTTILLAAMRDFLLEYGDDGRATSIEHEFLFRRDFRTQQIVSRLTLNHRDNDFFKKFVLSRPGTADRLVTPQENRDSHIRIVRATEEAKERVRLITGPYAPNLRAEKLSDWIDYLRHKARVIQITVPDDADAYTIFETLNDRGVDLSISDLLKVNIFNVADNRSKEAEAHWESMTGILESVGGEELAKTYIRHLWVAMRGPTRERELLAKIREGLASEQEAVDLATALEENAKFYTAILNANHPHWKNDKTLQSLVTDINSLGVAQVRPLLLAIMKKFPQTEVESALRSIVSWSVRFLIYGGAGGGTLERYYSERAANVWAGKITTTSALRADMRNVLPTDVEFLNAFSTARVSRPHLARYYLRSMEAKAAGSDPCLIPNPDTDAVSLEHVLPENPDSGWGVAPDVAEAFYKRMGNLALLSTPVNNDDEVGNKAFVVKKPFLQAAPFKLTQEIAAYSKWGPEEIGKRQEALAKLAVETWPL